MGRRQSYIAGTGGCGAFGGNKELMYASQLICADICGIDRLVMYSVNEEIFLKAKDVYNFVPREITFDSLVNIFDSRHYVWGKSAGT